MQNEVQLSSAQPPAAASTSTQTHTACPRAEGLLGFPIFFFFFFWISAFRNLWPSLFFVLPPDRQSTAYLHKIEKGRLAITEHLWRQGSGAPIPGLGIRNQAGTWAAQGVRGAMCPSLTEVILSAQGDSFSWGHLHLRLMKNSYTTKSPFLISLFSSLFILVWGLLRISELKGMSKFLRWVYSLLCLCFIFFTGKQKNLNRKLKVKVPHFVLYSSF